QALEPFAVTAAGETLAAIGIDFRIRVDERQHAAARQRVLVDGIEGGVAEPDRLHHHQHVDIVRDLLYIAAQDLEVEELAYLVDDAPLGQIAELRMAATGDRQAADQANRLLLGKCKRVDEFRKVILEERLTFEADDRHHQA